jgi:hypothetical protein
VSQLAVADVLRSGELASPQALRAKATRALLHDGSASPGSFTRSCAAGLSPSSRPDSTSEPPADHKIHR